MFAELWNRIANFIFVGAEKGYGAGFYVLVTAIAVALALPVCDQFCVGRAPERIPFGVGRASERGQEYLAESDRAAKYTGGLTRQQLRNRILAVAIFLLLFAVSACRIAMGNDYWVYRSDFLLIEQNRHTSFEFGFIWVVKAMQAILNEDQYIPIFALFSFFTVFFMVRAIYRQSEQFAMSIFILMTAGYFFSSMNSVRYFLVLSIALYSMGEAIEGNWGRFVLWILLGACFHKSVLVVIPLYILAMIPWKKWHVILLAVGCGSLLVFEDLYRRIIFTFYPFYEGSAFDTGETSITNLARCGGIFIFSLLYYRKAIAGNRKNRFYFTCNLFALLLYTFGSFIPEISRIGFYLNITNLFLVPAILVRIENKKQRIFWTVAIGLAFLGYFALYLRSTYAPDIRVLPYYNWIYM